MLFSKSVASGNPQFHLFVQYHPILVQMSPFYQDSNGIDMVYGANSITQTSNNPMVPFPISSSFSEGMTHLARSESLVGSPSIQSPQIRPRRRERTPEAGMDVITGEQVGNEILLEKPGRLSKRRNSSQIPVLRCSNMLSDHEQVILLNKDEYPLLQYGNCLVSREQRNIFRSYNGNDDSLDTEEQAVQEESVRPSLRRRWKRSKIIL